MPDVDRTAARSSDTRLACRSCRAARAAWCHSEHVTDLTAETPQQTTPLATAKAQLAGAVEILGYDEGLHRMLATPRREMNVAVPLRRDDGEIELFTGYRVQHNISRGPGKGGLRYSASASTSTRSARSPCG